MIINLLNYSKLNFLSHIPSALSMLDYIDVLFTEKYIVPFKDKIILGKPFGSQTYYLVWKDCGYLDGIKNLSVGVKHNEIPFVDFSEETMGNALGVATGIAMATPTDTVYVNLSDASLQMGSTLEAIAYIGAKQLKNIVVTVDYNQMQVTGKTGDIICIKPISNLFKDYGWTVIDVDGHDKNKLRLAFDNIHLNRKSPLVYFCHTKKGKGVHYMEADPVSWHYKLLV
jgi:transketolase